MVCIQNWRESCKAVKQTEYAKVCSLYHAQLLKISNYHIILGSDLNLKIMLFWLKHSSHPYNKSYCKEQPVIQLQLGFCMCVAWKLILSICFSMHFYCFHSFWLLQLCWQHLKELRCPKVKRFFSKNWERQFCRCGFSSCHLFQIIDRSLNLSV